MIKKVIGIVMLATITLAGGETYLKNQEQENKKIIVSQSSENKIGTQKETQVIMQNQVADSKTEHKLTIQVGEEIFEAILYEKEAAKEFTKLLPLTVNMSELNGNEKYAYLENSFTSRSESVDEIKSGDLMLYGSDCLALLVL